MEHGDVSDPRSRRDFVRLGAGLMAGSALAASGGAAMGQEGQARQASATGGLEASVGLANPVDKYPKPPFAKQQQPWPGLAGKMNPKPDHGETSYKGSGRLAGRRALITGGDSGIGRAVAIAFAREGADVAINYLPAEEEDAREVVELIRQAGRKAVTIPGDLREEQFCVRLVEEAVKQLGGLDILVNNAARQQSRESIEEVTTEDFDATFKTNVYAPFWITKAAVRHLPAGAAVIYTASEQAFDPSPNLLDYAQTKACNAQLAKIMAKQLAARGIRVNAVAPGPIWTPLQVSGGANPEKLPQFGEQSLFKRPGQPAELASAYVTLAENNGSFTTAQVYGVTGGKVLL
jgi:NAD(P)-dependent dehydrogenase (short-subunit alcohol dehydrogenase family)